MLRAVMVAATAAAVAQLSQQEGAVARSAVGAELILVARPLRVAQEAALLLVVECCSAVLAVQEVFEFQVKALEAVSYTHLTQPTKRIV